MSRVQVDRVVPEGDGSSGSALREMTFAEAEAFIHGYLGDGRKHSTTDINQATARAGKRCPDSTVRFLSRLRLLGKVAGELSAAHRSWLWWRPDFAAAPAPPVEEA